MTANKAALSRFKVLDLTRARAGPTAARMIADWGAETIKIEQPPALSEIPLGGPRDGFDFQNLHRNKRSMTLNLKEARGREIFLEMAKTADVVIENYTVRIAVTRSCQRSLLESPNPSFLIVSEKERWRSTEIATIVWPFLDAETLAKAEACTKLYDFLCSTPRKWSQGGST